MNASFSGRIHANSVAAFQSEEPKLSKRAEAIFAWILERGPKTDREVMQGMGFPDMNNVRPRLSELVDAGRLMEVCNRKCAVTGKTVRVLDVRRPRQPSLFSSQEMPAARSDCRSMLAGEDVNSQ